MFIHFCFPASFYIQLVYIFVFLLFLRVSLHFPLAGHELSTCMARGSERRIQRRRWCVASRLPRSPVCFSPASPTTRHYRLSCRSHLSFRAVKLATHHPTTPASSTPHLHRDHTPPPHWQTDSGRPRQTRPYIYPPAWVVDVILHHSGRESAFYTRTETTTSCDPSEWMEPSRFRCHLFQFHGRISRGWL